MRADLLKDLASDQVHYERDTKDGKQAIAKRAEGFDEVRQDALERTHTLR